MAIEGISGIQANGYQANQPVARQVDAVSISPSNTASAVDMSNTAQTGNVDGRTYDAQRRGEVSNEQIKKAVSDMNKKMQNTSAQFGIHEGTGRVTIKIVDKETKDVIKEFPAEETLEMIAKAWELAGIMVDEKL